MSFVEMSISRRGSMKTFLYIFLSIAVYITTADPINIAKDENSRFIEIPDDDGNFRLVDLKSEPNLELVTQLERNPANNEYYLFTRQNPSVPQALTLNASSVLSSNFNPNSSTLVTVHGWTGNSNSPCNVAIRNASLGIGNFNVIAMDWRQLASADYNTAVAGIPAVGRGLGQFLDFLGRITGMSFGNVHLVGFSLGAHVVGNAGKQLNGRLARITGLDPAGPLWTWNPNRLHSGDAVYVEGIHTDASPNGVGIGFAATVGHVDFYPNGGAVQPGCTNSHCNHNRAWEQFAASITHNHLIGQRCLNMSQVQQNTCDGNSLRMGNADLIKQAVSGIYRVNTGSQYPF